MNKAALTLATAALAGLNTLAATLSSGSAILNYSQSGVEALGSGLGPAPVLTLSTYFNQSESASRTAAQLGTDLIPGSTYTGQIYGMNGTSVVNLDGRSAQPTTFSYSAGDLAGHTGVIGLGGVARFDVFGGIGGSLLMGDLTLQYDINRTLVGGSGWFLKGNIPPAAALFDLTSVSIGIPGRVHAVRRHGCHLRSGQLPLEHPDRHPPKRRNLHLHRRQCGSRTVHDRAALARCTVAVLTPGPPFHVGSLSHGPSLQNLSRASPHPGSLFAGSRTFVPGHEPARRRPHVGRGPTGPG